MSLQANNISVVRHQRTLLQDISIDVLPGELVVIVGPNGAGKSTLLGTLAGDDPVASGDVLLAQRSILDYPVDELALLRAVVATPPVLAFDYTVRDVVAMGWLHGHGDGEAQFVLAITQVLEQQCLTGLANRRYMTLSSGERQRVAFARACMQLWRPAGDMSPRWLLLDEPTANLDVAHGVAMLQSLKQRASAGDGVLAILHDLDLAARFADRIAVLESGRLVALGKPDEVLTPALLSRVYGAQIHVEHHAGLNRLVVIG